MELLAFDLHLNDFYGMGEELWRQATGVAIGGFLSAANADIVLMEAERRVGWGAEFPDTVQLARFRDNVFGSCPEAEAHYWIPKIKGFLENIYGLPLTYETLGHSATFFECQVTIQGPHIRWGLKNKKLLSHLGKAPVV